MTKNGVRGIQNAKHASISKPERTRRRVTRACDECRLHKAKCNGQQSCDTCLRNGRVCSYNLLPSESQGSAARIRILEHRLTKARECIAALQQQVPYAADTDTTQILAPQNEEDTHSSINLTLASKDMSIAITSTPFIVSLVQPFFDEDHIRRSIHSQTARLLCPDQSAIHDQYKIQFCQLPCYDTALEAIYTSFNTIFGLCNIVAEQDFRQSMHRLYNTNPLVYTAEDTEFRILFFAVLALGLLSCSTIHGGFGYSRVIKESLFYFQAANSTVTSMHTSSPALEVQVRLCLVLYLLNTSSLQRARSMLKTLCSLPMVADLLRIIPTLNPEDPSPSAIRSKDTIWMIFYIDMYISILTQASPLMAPPGEEMATIHTINTAAHNVASCKHSTRSLLLSASIALAIEVLKLTWRVRTDEASFYSFTELNSAILPKQLEHETPLQSWNELKVELEFLERMLHSVLPKAESDPQIALARDEVQLLFYTVQIKLCHDSLHPRSPWMTISQIHEMDDFAKGQACITAASNAISCVSTRLQYTQVEHLSWAATYTIYIGSLALLLACTSAGVEQFHALQHSVSVAAGVLHSTTTSDVHSKAEYLNTIKAISTRLSMYLQLSPYEGSSPSTTFHSAISEFAIPQ